MKHIYAGYFRSVILLCNVFLFRQHYQRITNTSCARSHKRTLHILLNSESLVLMMLTVKKSGYEDWRLQPSVNHSCWCSAENHWNGATALNSPYDNDDTAYDTMVL